VNRRDFMRRSGLGLAGILAACAAPGIVRAAHIMPVRPIHEIGRLDGFRFIEAPGSPYLEIVGLDGRVLCVVPFNERSTAYTRDGHIEGIRYTQARPGRVRHTGHPTYFRLRDPDGQVTLRGTVGGPGSGQDMVLPGPSLVAGNTLSFDEVVAVDPGIAHLILEREFNL